MCFYVSLVFFFFKQKTAYEMRISDWSSDVCSSDLRWHRGNRLKAIVPHGADIASYRGDADIILFPASAQSRAPMGWPEDQARLRHQGQIRGNPTGAIEIGYRAVDLYFPAVAEIVRIFHCRSEEHTSELQSLMRISYAVFCLKKKTH